MTEIVPAILSNDISDFRKKYAELFALSHYFNQLHVDFADGNFVNNQTLMPAELGFLSASGKKSSFILAAHLMTFNPQRYFQDAKNSGFKWVLFHLEAFARDSEVEEAIGKAKNLGLKAGLVINPETPLHKATKFFEQVGLIQLMGIHPGVQGRKFIPATIEKIHELRNISKNVIISIDGGIKVGIARQCVQAGADILVAGSAILKAENEGAAIEALKADIET